MDRRILFGFEVNNGFFAQLEPDFSKCLTFRLISPKPPNTKINYNIVILFERITSNGIERRILFGFEVNNAFSVESSIISQNALFSV